MSGPETLSEILAELVAEGREEGPECRECGFTTVGPHPDEPDEEGNYCIRCGLHQ